MNETINEYDVVIVGGGYSGTMVAVHLARAQRGLRVALIERAKTPGRGVAYGTTDPKHLLNVRADQMGAFPDDVGHFYRWLQRHPQNLAAAGIHDLRSDAFIPRLVFGDYIQDLLRDARALPGTLDLIQDEIIDLQQVKDGRFELTRKSGGKINAAHVVLAVGNFPPGEAGHNRPWMFNNPYAAEIHQQLAEPGDLLIIGTGLTSLDVLMTLEKTKREGKIHVISRRGLFPQPHKKAEPYPLFLDRHDLPKTTRELFRRVVLEIRQAASRGIDWRPVIDSLRPLHQTIWTQLEVVEQRRFLRHVQGLWDTHRHRCAPEIMATKLRLEAEGRLICHEGHIKDYVPQGEHIEVAYRPRGTDAVEKFHVRRILSCTGPQSDVRKLNDPLVRQLLTRNLLAPDALRMGASTAAGGLIRNQAGEVINGLYTLGSTQKGRLYESIAVPELRVQAADLAARLLEEFKGKDQQAEPPLVDYIEDPRVYMAAERTFLAWVRTGLGFMGLGFVVARFGFLMREMGLGQVAVNSSQGNGFCQPAGIVLMVAGAMMSLYAAMRHGAYIRAVDQGRFRPAYTLKFAFLMAAFLAVVGLATTFYVAVLKT
ncbi:MAG TPA: FAD-dependent oxidoreductase [Candidatus Acidoferrum sp.]|nr:FAD-dependent oxidoreductase [Candidatus Acidoferrum sp.]